MMAYRFNPINHPRDRQGRFRRKGSIGVRVSTRSVSLTVGQRVPIVPGKVSLFVGGLVRLENASRTAGPLGRLGNRLTDSAVNAVPEGRFRNVARGLAGSGSFREGSTLITATTGRRSAPTIRAGRSFGGAPDGPNKGNPSYKSSGSNRAPNRKPRTRSTRKGNSIDMSGTQAAPLPRQSQRRGNTINITEGVAGGQAAINRARRDTRRR